MVSLLTMCRLEVLNSETISKTELTSLDKLCVALHIKKSVKPSAYWVL